MTVLYVEDTEADAFFVEHAFRQAGLRTPLKVLASGQEAVEYLEGAGRYGDRESFPLPAAVVLDLNLPGLSGFQLIEWVRSRPEFRSLPLLVFTASSFDADRERCRGLGADGYLVKPNDMTELPELLGELKRRSLVH